jgi:hypothetical protein
MCSSSEKWQQVIEERSFGEVPSGIREQTVERARKIAVPHELAARKRSLQAWHIVSARVLDESYAILALLPALLLRFLVNLVLPLPVLVLALGFGDRAGWGHNPSCREGSERCTVR